ncbi:hypothetical protein DPSP01_008490 [Paraphaeosphaeria sporulosa]
MDIQARWIVRPAEIISHVTAVGDMSDVATDLTTIRSGQGGHLQLRADSRVQVRKEILLTICCGPERSAHCKVSACFSIVLGGSLPASIHFELRDTRLRAL